MLTKVDELLDYSYLTNIAGSIENRPNNHKQIPFQRAAPSYKPRYRVYHNQKYALYTHTATDVTVRFVSWERRYL